jgi:hypothetical protein
MRTSFEYRRRVIRKMCISPEIFGGHTSKFLPLSKYY